MTCNIIGIIMKNITAITNCVTNCKMSKFD